MNPTPFERTLLRVFTVYLAALAVLSLCGYDFLSMTDPAKEDPFRNGQARYMMLGALPLITWALLRVNPYLAAFWGWSFFLWILGNWQAFGMFDLALILCAACLGDAIRVFFKPHHALRTIVALAVAQAAYGLSQRMGFDPFFSFHGRFANEAIGTLGHFTLLGAFVGLGAVYFFAQSLRRPANLAGFLFCLAGVYACHSTMAVLGTAAGVWYVIYRRVPSVAFGSAAIGVAGLGAWKFAQPGAEFFGFSGREVVWPYVVRVWLEKPLTGHGPGYWAGALPTFGITGTNEDRWYQAHNDFLQVLPEQGLVGLAIVLAGLAYFFYRARELPPHYGAFGAALCVGALGNFLFHIPAFGLIGCWLLSLAHHSKGTPCKKFA